MRPPVSSRKGGVNDLPSDEELARLRPPPPKGSAPAGFRWINLPAIISGEDFEYRATVLCSFPKANGKVRYVVEDNGRLFIQREAQISFIYGD